MTESLRPLDFVRAFWEGGAAAYGRVDEWSDLDLYVMTTSGMADDVFRTVEKVLRQMSPISEVYKVASGWEGVEQRFYRLALASEYLFVDLAVVSEDSSEKFITPEIHGSNVFYVDKDGLEGSARLDRPKFVETMNARRVTLGVRFRMFDNQVQKHLNRGNSIEALEVYRSLVIGTLVELLRMKHGPEHYNFRMEHIYDELPRSILKRVESLCYVKDLADLETKHEEAAKWVLELLSETPA